MNPNFRIALPIALLVMLAGCAHPGYYGPVSGPVSQNYPPPVQSYPVTSSPSYAQTFGTIDSIQVRQGGADPAAGAGAVIGGVVGGLLGNQVGGGNGRAAATVAGVIGGAMIGNQVERNTQARGAYQVGVRLDNGSYQTVVQDNVADLYVGSRVRIENDRVYRY